MCYLTHRHSILYRSNHICYLTHRHSILYRSRIAGIRRWVPNRAFYTCFYSKKCSDLTPVQCFLYFFIPLSSKTPIFESLLGRWPARNALKTRCFSWEGYQKVEKTSCDSSDCKKHLVKCQVAKMLTVKTKWKWKLQIGKVNFTLFLLVFVIEFSFSPCFTVIFDAVLLKSCSTAAWNVIDSIRIA